MTADTLSEMQESAIRTKDDHIGSLLKAAVELKSRCDQAETTAMLRGVELEANKRELRRLRCETWMAAAWGIGIGLAIGWWIWMKG